MAAGSNHSAVFDALFAWETKLQQASFPENPTTGRVVPEVTIGDLDAVYGDESVILAIEDPLDAQLRFESVNPVRRREVIVLTCRIKTQVKNTNTAKAAMLRLQALAEVVQNTIFDKSANQPVVALGFDNELLLGNVRSVLPSAFPVDGGWYAECDITIEVQAKN